MKFSDMDKDLESLGVMRLEIPREYTFTEAEACGIVVRPGRLEEGCKSSNRRVFGDFACSR